MHDDVNKKWEDISIEDAMREVFDVYYPEVPPIKMASDNLYMAEFSCFFGGIVMLYGFTQRECMDLFMKYREVFPHLKHQEYVDCVLDGISLDEPDNVRKKMVELFFEMKYLESCPKGSGN